MKLSISNIAWSEEYDTEMYEYISTCSFSGIEIAPTRLIKNLPYNHIEDGIKFAINLKERYNLEIPSMQSIWFGRQEKLFGTTDEREQLFNYTKKAIDFANSINCKNIVFGCPKNRVINDFREEYKIALDFFRKIGDYSKSKDVNFAIEPNPAIYNTNFINTTEEAINLVKDINNEGITINLDLGTIIQNNEDIDIIQKNIKLISHVHISEPNLEYIQPRKLHSELIEMLNINNYRGYLSIEMKNQNDIDKVKEKINYINYIVQEVTK